MEYQSLNSKQILRKNVLSFFKYDKSLNKSFCLLLNCEKQLSGQLLSNLKRHLTLLHPAVAKEINLIDSIGEKANNNTTSSSNHQFSDDNSLDSSGVTSFNDRAIVKGEEPTNKKRKWRESRFLKGCIKMCMDEYIPIQIFNSEAFRLIKESYTSVTGIHHDTTNMAATFNSAASEIREIIADTLKCGLFSIKLDAVTNHQCDLLVINAKALFPSEIEVLTLGAIDLTRNIKGDNVRTNIETLLEETYGLTTAQVYSVTTDNGTDLVRPVLTLDEDQRYILESKDLDFEDIITETHNEFYMDVAEQLEMGMKSGFRNYENCVAINLHQVMVHVSKKYEAQINTVREFVKRMKSQEFREIFDSTETPRPLLDVETRWMTTYLMVKSLFDHMDFYKDPYLHVQLPAEIQNFVSKYVEGVTPLYSAAKRFQEEQLIMGK
jgi:hypothetical protein